MSTSSSSNMGSTDTEQEQLPSTAAEALHLLGQYPWKTRIHMFNGQPHFCARDICHVLGYTNSRMVTRELINPKHCMRLKDIASPAQHLKKNAGATWYLSMDGVKALAHTSRMPQARVLAELLGFSSDTK